MIEPILHHFPHAKPVAALVAQFARLDPQLMLPAALPLIAARLMDAGGADEELEPEVQEIEPELDW